MVYMMYQGIQGGAATVSTTFYWGIGSLASSWTGAGGMGVNYVVVSDPTCVSYVTPTVASTLYYQMTQVALNNTVFRVLIIQL